MPDQLPDSEAGIFTGTAGWEYPDWKGIVYPEKMSRATKPLSLLSQWFDLVEINVTFYRPIAPRQCVAWLQQTAANPRFMFCAKLPSALTHDRSTKPDTGVVAAFRESMMPLTASGKLGAVLAQFPWSFKRTPENRHYLSRLADSLDGLPLAVEVRHVSWDHPDFMTGLTERGIALCNIDQPLLSACLASTAHVTAPFGYVRLHGRNQEHWFNKESGRNERYNYLYNQEELAPWIERIKNMREQVNRLYVVTNNHYRGQAVVNALEIEAALKLKKPHRRKH
jgi:uncharacterized protein YecE (DUF72 family)